MALRTRVAALSVALVAAGGVGCTPAARHEGPHLPTYGPCPTHAGACRVLPLGDSITYGAGDPQAGGYRTWLWQWAIADGNDLDFLGSQRSGPPSLPDRDHEGHPGWTIADIAREATSWVAAARPDVVLLLAGTNDIAKQRDLDTAPERLGRLVDRITDLAPNASVLVGTVIPLRYPLAPPLVQAYNRGLAEIVAGRAAAGRRVALAPLHDAVDVATDYADEVHPNPPGYRKMAQVWYGTLRELVSAR